MNAAECSQLSLVEALRDGRLGPHEQASVTRHLAHCAACGAVVRDFDRIRAALDEPLPAATPLEHQRARHELQRRAAETPLSTRPPPARRRGLVVALVIAAMMFTTVIGWAGGRLTAPPRPPPVVTRLELGSRFSTTVGPAAGTRFERVREDGLDAVTLTSGALDVAVHPLAFGERFVLRTSDAEVVGHGSTFRVEADQGRIRGITVTRGSVAVHHGGFAAVIPSGGSWRATPDAPPATAPAPSAEPVPEAAPPPIEAPVAKRASRPAAPVAAREVVVAPPPPEVPASPTNPASREFAEAMRSVAQGDYEGGATRLKEFAAAHPRDARADEADYVRAVSLQRAGRSAEATEAARRYLSAHPDGAHRAEATALAR